MTVRHGVSDYWQSNVATLSPFERDSSARGRLAAIWLGYLALIVYGSLLPFDFRALPFEEALSRFFHISYRELGVWARADWIANLVLYVPLGYLAVAWARASARLGGWAFGSTLLLVLLAVTVAVAVEFTQLYFPPRTASLNDLLAEGLGLAGGVLLWLLAGARLTDLWRSVKIGGPASATAGLALYALFYLAISLFPYDFLVSAAEIRWKIGQDRFDWLLVSHACGEPLRCTAGLTVETLAAIPIGLLLGALLGRGARTNYGFAILIGLLMGLVLEGLQFFLASGVSHGASVVTRTAGVVVGLWLVRRVDFTLTRRVKLYARPLVAIFGMIYLALLALLNGWHGGPWQSSVEALDKLSSLRFIPFYYHYYVPEAVAVKSFLLQAAMYLPIGLVCWLWVWGTRKQEQSRAGVAAVLGAVLALVIESSKLFLQGQRPDPTSVLIAAFSAALAFVVARWIVRWSGETVAPGAHDSVGSANVVELTPLIISGADTPNPRVVVAAQPADPFPMPGLLRLSGAFCIGASVLWLLTRFPVDPLWVAAGLAIYGFVLWQRPWLWLVVVPATLPVLYFAPQTGWFFFDEFDLLLLVTLGVCLVRGTTSRTVALSRTGRLLIAAVAISYVISTLRGVFPLDAWDANAVSNYYSHYNSLRVAKGFAWAIVFLPLVGSALDDRERAVRLFSLGMLLGLAGASLAIAWERHLFSGLFDFSGEFRVTGRFAGMHVGGAAVEAYLVMALPFALFWVTRARSGWSTIAALTGLIVGIYALVVTFARGGYAGFFAGLLLMMLGPWMLRRDSSYTDGRRVLVTWLGAVGGLALVAASTLGPYMASRWDRAFGDWEDRVQHVQDTLRIMDSDWATSLFGMGLGSFPETYFWGALDSKVLGTYRYVTTGNNTYLQLGGGDALYMRQHVELRAHARYRLSLDTRGNTVGANLNVFFCEQTLLYARTCQQLQVGPVSTELQWERHVQTFDSGELGSGSWHTRRPVSISLRNGRVGSIIEVDNLQLVADDGQQLIRNGDFSRGFDHWFFAVDDHLPWHVKNLWVAIYFEQGWIGVVVILALSIYALALLMGTMDGVKDKWFALTVAASLVGLLVVGTTESPLDFPRLATLFYVLIWFAVLPLEKTEPAKFLLPLSTFKKAKAPDVKILRH